MAADEKQKRQTSRPPSIKDVAAVAGVSWRTVSNVIHGHKYLRDETKAKVEAAIEQLGYRPRAAARQLRGGRSNLLTLAIPYVAHPYFSGLAHAVVEAAGKRSYDVLIDETLAKPEREHRVARGYGSLLADGIIFSPLAVGVQELISKRDATPMVLLGEHTINEVVDHVVIENTASTREATDHLIAKGRRRFGFLGYLSQGTLGTGDLRFDGFRESLAAAGIACEDRMFIGASHSSADPSAEGDYSREAGFERAMALLPRIAEFDAIVCANDLLAIGFMHALRLNGVRVPEDVAVIGWDGAPEGAFTSPTLSTVEPDLAAIAELAVETLLDRVEHPDAPVVRRTAPHRLVLRESTAT